MGAFEAVILTIITASTPLLLAAIGELVVERSGVLNLGVEGMMVMGAVIGFVAAYESGSPMLGVAAGIGAGVAISLLFAFLTQTLVTNQVATGLALTLFGLGLSGLIGEAYTGLPGVKLATLDIPVLTGLPFFGPILFGQDIVVYGSFVLVAIVGYVLTRTRIGLIIRATGGNHHSAHALGYNVIATRYACIAFGGACAGLAGAYLSVAYTPQWIENMSAGRGWIALALVGVLDMAAASGCDRCVFVRYGVDHGFVRAGARYRHSLAAAVVAAIPGNDCGLGGHLGKPDLDQSKHPGVHRAIVCSGPLARGIIFRKREEKNDETSAWTIGWRW